MTKSTVADETNPILTKIVETGILQPSAAECRQFEG